MVAGVQNSHKTLFINNDKMQFTPTHIPNKDMEFGRFQEFLRKVGRAVYLIDPSEIGFPMSGNSEGTSGLGGDSTKEKLQYSKDKGLKPLLKKVQYWINKYIVWQIDPEFEFRFVGVDGQEDKQTELDADIKMVGSFKGFQEVRDKYNLGQLRPDDLILNPIWMQNKMMASQGDPNNNDAVDQQDSEEEDSNNKDKNPFMKSLSTDLERLLS